MSHCDRLTTDSGKQGSPHFYRRREDGALLVQGYCESNPGFSVPRGEEVVRVPAILAVDAVCALVGEVTVTDLSRMFELLSTSAFRQQLRMEYLEEEERDDLDHWDRTGQVRVNAADHESWRRMLASHLGCGRTIRRVHLIRRPVGRYKLWEGSFQIAMGEDIRFIDADKHPEVLDGNPGEFWLFDDRVAVGLDFDAHNRLVGLRRLDDEVIGELRGWRDRLWGMSVPFATLLRDAEAA